MVSLVEKIILTHLPMKQIPSKIGLRLRELRQVAQVARWPTTLKASGCLCRLGRYGNGNLLIAIFWNKLFCQCLCLANFFRAHNFGKF